MRSVLEAILSAPAAAPIADDRAWWARHRAASAGAASAIDEAILGGAAADRVAWAFAAGYQGALRALLGGAPLIERWALAATEDGGAHPRAIATRVGEDGTLSGRKRFVTGGASAERLLVVASQGIGDDGRNRLCVLALEAGRAGIRFEETPPLPLPFAPELHHATVVFERVPVREGDVLEGDGYERWLKPFRTVEDVHVYAALFAHVVQVARHGRWPVEALERMLAVVCALRALAAEDPGAAATHVALAGVIGMGRRMLDECSGYFDLLEPELRARWERDRPLLDVAGRARELRRASAWRVIDG